MTTRKPLVIVSGQIEQLQAGDILSSPIGANPTATASDVSVNGSATTFMRSDGAPPVQKASASQFGIVEVDGSTITATGGVISAALGGRLIGIQRGSTHGTFTYTPTTGTSFIILELIGAGAGGSGVASPGANQIYLASGGTAGGWLRKKITTGFSGATIVVGAKGTGGSAGANNGNNGSNSTFTTTDTIPITYTAVGGTGGTHNGPFGPPFMCGGAIGNIQTGGDDNLGSLGAIGGFALSTTTNAVSGSGGGGPYGSGGGGQYEFSNNSSLAGINGSGVGAGGGGAVAIGTGGAKAGGDGTDGGYIIWEFS